MKTRLSGMLLSLALLGAPALRAQDGIQKVSLSDASAAVVTKTAPEYPALGKQLKLEGKVELEAVVAENGQVEKVNIVSGNPILTKAAVEAVRHWKFKPFVIDGKASKVIAPISIGFKL